MDAICFVFGVSAKHLRGEKLKDLIWRVSSKGGAAARAAKSATVTVVYVTSADELEGHAAGDEVSFSRTVSSTGTSTYRLDGSEVSFDAYSKALEAINIVTKARNFLVFQVSGAGTADAPPTLLRNNRLNRTCIRMYVALAGRR